MKPPKQLVADFYLALLDMPITSQFRLNNQELYGTVRDVLAAELNEDSETVQRIFENMRNEDAKTS